jgi:hypothetical protein
VISRHLRRVRLPADGPDEGSHLPRTVLDEAFPSITIGTRTYESLVAVLIAGRYGASRVAELAEC